MEVRPEVNWQLETLKLRAAIDSEVTKGLLLINGGSAVGLLAFLPHTIGRPDLRPLAIGTVVALVVLAVALFLTVAANRLRRICSLKHDAARITCPTNPRTALEHWRFLGREYDEPMQCKVNVWLVWMSGLLFLVATASVVTGAIATLCCSSTLGGAGFDVSNFR